MVIAGAEGPKWGRSPVLDIGRREFITLLGGAVDRLLKIPAEPSLRHYLGQKNVQHTVRYTEMVPAPSYSPAAASSTRIRRPGSLGYWLPRLLRITMPSFRVGIIPI